MRNLTFNYLAPAAKRLIPKWAKNWRHPDQIPDFREAFKKFSPDEREKRLRACRMVGWRLWLAFHTDDEYERDWLLYEARRINAAFSAPFVIAMDKKDGRDRVRMLPKDNPLDSLLRFVQTHLLKRMAVCHRGECKNTYYFREPGRHGQRYCRQFCTETERREGKLRCYHESQPKEPRLV